MTRPCVPAEGQPDACVAALLHGVPCCTDLACVACSAERHRMRISGYSPAQVAYSAARFRFAVQHAPPTCPICGCHGPAPARALPALPRLDRSHLALVAETCVQCGSLLGRGGRKYCSETCRIEHRRATEGFGDTDQNPIPGRSFRVHFRGDPSRN